MRTRSAAGVAVRDITPPIGIELVGYHRPLEWMPVVYGQESGFLMPPVPETADRILRHILRLSASQ